MKDRIVTIKDILINLLLVPLYHLPAMLISIMGFSGMIEYGENFITIVINITLLIIIQVIIHLFPDFLLYKIIEQEGKEKFKFWSKVIIIISLLAYSAMLLSNYL